MKGIGFQKTGIVFSVALHVCCFMLILSLPKERFLSESEPIQVSLESLGSPTRSGIAEKKRQGRPGPVRQRLTAAPAPPVENFERSEPEPLAAEVIQTLASSSMRSAWLPICISSEFTIDRVARSIIRGVPRPLASNSGRTKSDCTVDVWITSTPLDSMIRAASS